MKVNFTCQPNEKGIVDKLKSAGKPKNDAAAKALAKDCLTGKESTLTCRLSKTEDRLGRSTVIDLPTQGFR